MAGQQQQWASQAAINSLLRYRPQQEGLADLKRAAEERFRSSVQAGRSEGVLGQQAAQAAVAPTQQVFKNAATEGERGRNLVNPVLAALSADNPFRLAAGNEQAAGQERLAQSQAHALSDLQQRKVAASELPAFTRAAALSKLVTELQTLSGKGQALRGAEGLNVQSEIDKQRTEAKKAALTERGQNLSAQSAAEGRRVTERGQDLTQQRAQEKGELALAEYSGKGLRPIKEQGIAVSLASTIQSEAKQLRAAGRSRAIILQALEQAEPSVTKEEADGSKATTKGHPGYAPNGVTEAALDNAELGGLQKATERKLRSEGYDPRRFGKAATPPRKIAPGPHRRPA